MTDPTTASPPAARLGYVPHASAQAIARGSSKTVALVVSDVERKLLAIDAPGAQVDILSNLHQIAGAGQPFGMTQRPVSREVISMTSRPPFPCR